jgi:hypothetical protein
MLKKFMTPLWRKISSYLEKRTRAELQLYSLGLMHARNTRARERIADLSEVEWQAFSQWGEDGILDWLVHHLPGIPETFVEFGVENYRESNTRWLLRARNWKGLVMDGSSDHMRDLHSQDICWKHELTGVAAFIDAGNINDLLTRHGFTGEIGLLSIDIDGNDYWVWQAIHTVQPALVVCEYNAVFGDLEALTIPYDAQFVRSRAHASHLYYGASIRALIHLATEKGYTFLGTNRHGSSGFFVRNDLAAHLTGRIERIRSWPSRFREARDGQGRLLFLSGEQRAAVIGSLPVVRIPEEKVVPLSSLDRLYSKEWMV